MRYLSLAEALVVAEVVTGLPARTLVRTASFDLLDSALHAPQAQFGGTEFYPDLPTKAAVLVARITRNHTHSPTATSDLAGNASRFSAPERV